MRRETHPRLKLAAHLANALKVPDPLAIADRWLGRLLAAADGKGLDSACAEIELDLRGLEEAARERNPEFRLWTDADRPPATVERVVNGTEAVLTGQLPTVQHLREGRFASRRVYGDVAESTRRWLAETVDDADTLPVFWIAGRSGSGKSVALLHLLAALHDEGHLVVWLGNREDAIDKAIAHMRPFFREGHSVILAADDPYRADRASDVARAVSKAVDEWRSIRDAYPAAHIPRMITCGPSEQAKAFEDDLIDETRVFAFELHAETAEDIDELRHWYMLRTGRTNLPIGDASDVLIVQLFFEWATGAPLREFAKRFRARLRNMPRCGDALFDLIAGLLALERNPS